MKLLQINWYTKDPRFEDGTVADIGYSLRIVLDKIDSPNEYRLYMLIRTSKEDGVKEDLKRGVLVAKLKKCTLEEAQNKTREYMTRWTLGIINDTDFL
jgi:hypothetical protein